MKPYCIAPFVHLYQHNSKLDDRVCCISKVLNTIDLMEHKVSDVVIASDRCRDSIKALILTAKAICNDASRQRREDIANANERCRSVAYSCDKLLAGIQGVINEIDEHPTKML